MSVKRLNDFKFMRFALSLAGKGKGNVSPNPMVGCVIVYEGKIVGQGYHEYFGGPHAEINALSMAGDKASGSTLYVTLEPCNHYGKTPPCTDAIIKAGVKRVVVATLDPNKTMHGRGLKILSRESIQVTYGVLRKQATRFYSGYLKSRMDGKPKVIVKAAMSVDGKIATRTGDSKWISSRQSRAVVHKLRSTVDAVVVGSKTVLRDNPRLTSHGLGRNPVRVILDPELKAPLRSSVFNGKAPTIVFYAGPTAQNKLDALQKRRILTVRMPHRRGRIQFRDVISKLKQYSLYRVLIEGGGETIASALESRVVNEVILFIAPKIIGGRLAKTPVEGFGIANIKDSLILHEPRISRIGPDWMLRAKVNNK